MPRYCVRLRLEYTATVYVEAEDKDAAKAKIKSGDWEDEQLDELVNWGDHYSNPDSITEES